MTNMEGPTDEFERPLQFRPSWPPRAEDRELPNYKPGFSLAFRKPNWPPPTDEAVTTDSSATGESNGPSNAPESSQGGAAGASPSQNNYGSAGGGPGPKPKKPQGDYSAHFSKNALPHYEIKFVVKPDKVHLPEIFLGDAEEDSEK